MKEATRLILIRNGALGIACKLLTEEAKGPQRKISMQILFSLAEEGNFLLISIPLL